MSQTEEENAAELKNYDDKVYRASVDMADALVLELRGLGIPFFAIKRDLIDSSKAATPTIPRRDLETFQRRMLELLQDLCKE